MNHKRKSTYINILMSIILMSSCAPGKNIAYFEKDQKDPSMSNGELNSKSSNKGIYRMDKSSVGLYSAHIKPKDLLSITVVSSEAEASRIYNLVVPQIDMTPNQNNLFSQPTLQTYLVDIDGNINFPVFGKLRVVGLTRKELESTLLDKLSPAFGKEKPIITIRFVNYSVNILGEVQKPGKYDTTNDRLTIFEGLALASDLSIYGRRDNVKVLRENVDGSKEYITVNLNDKDVIYSPAYYLEQNDVVYVEPNKSRSRSSNYGAAESFGISSLSVLLTLTSLIFTVFKLKI